MERTILSDRIELREPTGLAEGQEVEILVRTIQPGDGIRRSADPPIRRSADPPIRRSADPPQPWPMIPIGMPP